MNYKDTIMSQRQMKWQPLKIRQIKDGKIELKLTISLTELFDAQAKQAFMRGVVEALGFVGNCQKTKVIITTELLDQKFTEWGIPELSKLVKEAKHD